MYGTRNAIAISIFAATLLAGCASQYRPEAFSGGYTETQLSANVWQIGFRGNGLTGEQRAIDLALLRSAELTLQNGYTHFQLTNSNVSSSNSSYTTPTTYQTTGTAYRSGNMVYGQATTRSYGGDTIQISKPRVSNTVVMYKGNPSNIPSMYTAALVCASIGKQYQVECKAADGEALAKAPVVAAPAKPSTDASPPKPASAVAQPGAQGNNCVAASAKVGDTLKAPSGNTAIVKSLLGTSPFCMNPALPIRAQTEFQFSFAPKANLIMPAGFTAKPLSEMQRYNGIVVGGENASERTSFILSSRGRSAATHSPTLAQAIATNMIATLGEGKAHSEEELSINAMKAYRFEVTGTSKDLFHPRITYIVTMLEGERELAIVTAWMPAESYDKHKDAMRQLAFQVSGI